MQGSNLRSWWRFNLVGVGGFVLQTSAIWMLTRTMPRLSYLAATALAVELAVLSNFVGHQRWTWKHRPSSGRSETIRRLAKFNVTTGLVSIAGNLILMGLLVGRFGLPIVPANLVTVVACSLLSFFLADKFAFGSDTISTV